MSDTEFKNIKLPALVKYSQGSPFIVNEKEVLFLYSYDSGWRQAHQYEMLDIIKEDYDEQREQMNEIENLL